MNPMGSPGNRPDATSWIVAAVCGYEVAAIFSNGHLPTISRLQHKFEPLAWVVVGFLAYHFKTYEERKRELVAENAADRAVAKARIMGMLPRPARA